MGLLDFTPFLGGDDLAGAIVSTRHNTNRKHNIHHTPYTNIQHTSTLQGSNTPLSLTTAATQQTLPQIPTQSQQQTYKQACAIIFIHTSIVSRHLATRGNNKILRTPPPHISSSEEILPRITLRTVTQLRTNKSPFLKSHLHKVDAKTHPSPLCPLCNTHPHTHHVVATGFMGRPC